MLVPTAATQLDTVLFHLAGPGAGSVGVLDRFYSRSKSNLPLSINRVE